MNKSSFDPRVVKQRCNGMLPVEVYQKIYDTALAAPGKIFVEVGCAHGAGTVCLAAALRDSGREGKVYTFEKIIGGSREAFGTFEENRRTIEGNFSHFGLEDRIELIIGDVEDHAQTVPDEEPIGLLCLDADGAIDRDFALFFDRVIDGGPIILDDVQNRTRIKKNGIDRLSQKLRIDQKHLLTYRMLGLFQEYGLVNEGVIHGDETWFGYKCHSAFADIDPKAILKVYRSITFTDGAISLVPMRSIVVESLRKVLPKSAFERLKSLEGGKQ